MGAADEETSVAERALSGSGDRVVGVSGVDEPVVVDAVGATATGGASERAVLGNGGAGRAVSGAPGAAPLAWNEAGGSTLTGSDEVSGLGALDPGSAGSV